MADVAQGSQDIVTSPIDAFMARVLDDPAAQARLATPTAVPEYVAAAVALAADYGIALPPGDVEARLQPDPLGLSRFEAPPVTLDRWPGPGWLPARSVPYADPPAFDWAFFGDAPLREPLYVDSTRTTTALPFNRMFRTRTSLGAVIAGQAGPPVTPPTGFVFHMSRCGSTLAGRMLMAVPRHAVASEPEPLDAILQWAALSGAPHDEQSRGAARDRRRARTRARTRASGASSSNSMRWHVLLLPLIRAAFPGRAVDFPLPRSGQVIMSHQAEPGCTSFPAYPPPALSGLDIQRLRERGGLYRACARGDLRAVIGHWPLGGGMLVPFDESI